MLGPSFFRALRAEERRTVDIAQRNLVADCLPAIFAANLIPVLGTHNPLADGHLSMLSEAAC